MFRFRSLVPRALAAAFAVSLAASLAVPSTAAEKAAAPEETRAVVPALEDYHDVIRVIWHDAWPKKDAAMLRKLVTPVTDGARAVAEAKLPGILRDKKAAWEEGVGALEKSVADYVAAAAGSNDQNLLDAAEALHACYEALVRVIRPPLKELDAFHVVLYQLYHYDLPSDDLAAMRKTIATLQEQMAALDAAQVPQRLKRQQKEFRDARTKLSQAVASLGKTAASNDVGRVKAMIEEVHARYEMTVAVCD